METHTYKLHGSKYHGHFQKILVTAAFCNAKVEVCHVHPTDPTYCTEAENSPTRSLPLLETKDGKLSEANAIANYIANNSNPAFLGKSSWEKAQVAQWTDFAGYDLHKNTHSCVYPLFGKL